MRVADKLEISRNLSMVIPADRAVLVEAAAGIPELARLVEEHLDDYLRLFPEDHWREVHSGGLIAIQSSKWLTTASNIQRMLETTEKLKHLEAFPGFSTLLSGFRDAAKVDATLFEVSAATWCATRTASLGLEFSPEITVKDRQKHPDFLWHTVYGDLYCECKGARIDLSPDSR